MTLAVSRLLVRTRAHAGAPPAYARAVAAVAAAGGGTTAAITTGGGRGHGRRLFSAEAVARPVQVYVSRSHDPFLNLSLEHYLLQKSAPESVVLFLYTNRPCVVIGRNQNPWLEVNLALLDRPGVLAPPSEDPAAAGVDDINSGVVELVRRRSGGGTVFHDYGNVNYSVLCPPAAFDRNKHAEMVVRALRGLGVATARVNERHDIVVSAADADAGGNSFSSSSSSSPPSFKVSGSAYKLTRLRSLHHGTCLLSTPNLARIGRFLRSPAAPYLKARGVESVRSPIRNVGLPRAAFEDAVVAEFAALYGRVAAEAVGGAGDGGGLLDRLPGEVAKGYAELKSPEWIYTQTPQFTFSTQPSDEDPRARPALPDYLPEDFHLSLTVRHGQITQARGSTVKPMLLETLHLHKVGNWCNLVGEPAGDWLNGMFGLRHD